MSELRQDATTGNWVIVAPERGRRPRTPALRPSVMGTATRLALDPACPFCPGQEDQTPPELWRLESPFGGWEIRSVANKFPVLRPEVPLSRLPNDGFLAMAGHGHHEVVVESPRHDWDLATATPRELRDVVGAWRSRYQMLRSETDASVITIFRNHGAASGTSLEHPHSQIVAAPIVPLQLWSRHEIAKAHHDLRGSHLYLDLLARERRDGRRILIDGRQLVAFQPFAASVPYETWIIPRDHQPSFGDADEATLAELAEVLGAVLAALHRHLADPPYNLLVLSALTADEDQAAFSWHVQIVPRLSTPAGFELATGISVNASLPEDTAAELRTLIAAAAGDGSRSPLAAEDPGRDERGSATQGRRRSRAPVTG